MALDDQLSAPAASTQQINVQFTSSIAPPDADRAKEAEDAFKLLKKEIRSWKGERDRDVDRIMAQMDQIEEELAVPSGPCGPAFTPMRNGQGSQPREIGRYDSKNS